MVAADDVTQFFKSHPNVSGVEQGGHILFSNRRIGLAFKHSQNGFILDRLYGIAEDQNFLIEGEGTNGSNLFEVVVTLDPKLVHKDERWNSKPGFYGIFDEMAGDAFTIGSQSATNTSWWQEDLDSLAVLHLEWNGIDMREDKGAMDVKVTVTLRDGDPMSYWHINIHNRSQRYGIERIRFPMLSLAPIGKAENNQLLLPQNRGRLVTDPFNQSSKIIGEIYYACHFNMQFQALYDEHSGNGIYLGTQDPAPNLIQIEIDHNPKEILWRPSHLPPNMTFAHEDYDLPYNCVVGPFRGDWFDACQIYRQWALKQSWAQKGPLITRRDIPRWYAESPLMFYTHLNDSFAGTHSEEENMNIAADHFIEFLEWVGMPLSANWYAWKEHHPDRSTYNVPFNRYRMRGQGRWAHAQALNSHDGNYPKIPALPNFSSQCARIRQAGGRVCPYIALEIYDQGSTENAPYADAAKSHMVRDLYGAIRTWSGETAWQACSWTQWWRDRLKEECVLMLQRENVNGFYLDVMQGSSPPCYWTPHGHSAAGGSSTTKGMHGLSKYIRDAVKALNNDFITTGENASEGMIDVIDGSLQLTFSPDVAPLFAAVYQGYIPRFGHEISVGQGNAFFVEVASLFLEGAQIGMFRLRPRSSALSFQNPEHESMIDFLGKLVGYYKNVATRKFLAYGQLMRPLKFNEPQVMPLLSYRRRHGTTREEIGPSSHVPALTSGVFRTDNGELGIFVVNTGTEELDFQSDLNLTGYGLETDADVQVESFNPDGTSQIVHGQAIGSVPLSGTLPGHDVVMYRVK